MIHLTSFSSLSSFGSAGSEPYSPAREPGGQSLALECRHLSWEQLAPGDGQPRSPQAGSVDVMVPAVPQNLPGLTGAAGRQDYETGARLPPRQAHGGDLANALSPTRRVARLLNEPFLLQELLRSPKSEAAAVQPDLEPAYYGLVAAAASRDLSTFQRLCTHYRASISEWAPRDAAWLVRAATRAGADFARALLMPLEAERWHLWLAEDACRGFRNLLADEDVELLACLCAATADAPMLQLLNGSAREVSRALARGRAAVFLRSVMARLDLPRPPPPALTLQTHR